MIAITFSFGSYSGSCHLSVQKKHSTSNQVGNMFQTLFFLKLVQRAKTVLTTRVQHAVCIF